ncbi:MAG: AAA family ATPase [Bacillota bacterium]|nr:AAA family ATPase [Bacillota bacterium]
MESQNQQNRTRTHITRKNLICIGILFFYAVICFVVALCLDSWGTISENNPIISFASSMGFPRMNCGKQTYFLLALSLIYLLLYAVAFIYEMRLSKYYDNRILTRKSILTYLITLAVCLALWGGLGYLSQYPWDPEVIGNSYFFVFETMLLSAIFYVCLIVGVIALMLIVVNIRHMGEPYRWFDHSDDDEWQRLRDEEEEKESEEMGKLAESFGENGDESNAKGGVGAGVGSGTGEGGAGGDVTVELGEKERVFPGLCTIDYLVENEGIPDSFSSELIPLDEMCDRFRNYLAKQEGLYFDISTIRAFISGLSASRLLILEGLSGTGKSSLARYFSEFIGEHSFFEAVQATWRDRTSILGYYNDFSKSYNETEFLKTLYRASFAPRHMNIMVLDELNISRIEYYFADFLSILEYPVDEWKLRIMQLPYDFEAPEHLENGMLQIAPTTWFIGTANKDDSTFTITDKVYDRAITISFDDRNTPFVPEGNAEKYPLACDQLLSLFDEARKVERNRLSDEDFKKLRKVTDFTYETFDLTFGNRIMHQMELLVPVYVACGGSKEDALDFMFARKVVAKLEGRFEDYIKQGLLELSKMIEESYGKGKFPITNHTINKLLRKL